MYRPTLKLTSLACCLLFACAPTKETDDTGATDETTASEGTGPQLTTSQTDTGDTGDTGVTDDTGITDDTGVTDDTGEPPPAPSDMDGDGFPDDIDLCPSIAGADNTADSDRDGIGNACDLCQREPQQYNERAGDAQAPAFMLVRNIPEQDDLDRDGIGDVCDNCIVRSNCGEFGDGPDLTPARIGDATPFADASVCQIDDDALPFLGDACIDPVTQQPLELADAAGPVGFANDDDFDQDGLRNLVDQCPRIRVAALACTSDDDCAGARCTEGLCNHPDRDSDNVGDPCDSCPTAPNPKQVQDGGMQEEDADGDFVGSVCESHPACVDVTDPAPIGFNTLAVDGVCCVQLFAEDTAPLDPGHVQVVDDTCDVVDPALPLRVMCSPADENVTCRQLPKPVLARPGVVELPPGCAAVGEPLTLASPGIDQDSDKLYAFACRLPVRDSDFDGVGDACDKCPNAFDPDNTDTFCTGDYAPASNQPTCP